MAKDIVIRGVTYGDTPGISVPLASGSGNADFWDTSGATLNSGNQLLDGVIGIGADGTPYTGTIPSKSSSDLTVDDGTVNVPAGYYPSAASKSVASGSATTPATSITANPTISVSSGGLITASVSASQNVTPAVVEGYVESGTSGAISVSGSKTQQLTAKAAQTYTPTTSDQTIASGQYLTGTQTVKGDANLIPSNIVAGKSIFGVNGTAQIPVISQDPTTKIVSIS